MNEPKEIYIQELAQEINRRPHTIRCWERYEVLPKELRSARNNVNWRFWTDKQVSGIKQWMLAEDRRPGKGLPHYQPTESKIASSLEKVRKPRKNLPEAA